MTICLSYFQLSIVVMSIIGFTTVIDKCLRGVGWNKSMDRTCVGSGATTHYEHDVNQTGNTGARTPAHVSRSRNTSVTKDQHSSRTEIVEYQKTIQRLKEEIRKSGEDKVGLEQRVRLKDEQLKQEVQRHRKAEEELESRFKGEISEWQRADEAREKMRQELVQRTRQQRLTIDASTAQLLATTRERDKTRELLDARTSELQGARAYLSATDSISAAEVVKILESLNNEISQTAAMMLGEFSFGARAAVRLEVYNNIKERLGDTVTTSLMENDYNDDHLTLVQIAIQMTMAHICHRFVTLWTSLAQGSVESEQLLQRISYSIHQNEKPLVARKWQSLTRHHLGMMNENGRQVSIQQELMWSLMNILVLSGCQNELPDLQERITSRFKGKFNKIIGLAAELKRAMYEDLISMDLHLLLITNGAFESGMMRDADPPRRAQSVGTVAGTIELGLLGQETRKIDADTWVFGEDKILLKPVVVLSALFEREDKISEI